jgi:hypothetical protein
VALGLALLFSIATPYISRIAIALSVAFFTTHAFSMTLPEPPPPCGCLGTTSNSESLETRMSDSLWWLGLTAGMALCGCMVAAAPAQKKLATQKDQNEPIQEPVHAA